VVATIPTQPGKHVVVAVWHVGPGEPFELGGHQALLEIVGDGAPVRVIVETVSDA